jgi:hypothetical protein
VKRRGHWLHRIRSLDPVADHHEIYRISVGYEFPWDYQRALELALFRWRCLTGQERLAGFHFYRQVGLRMGIGDPPADFDEFRRLKDAYERAAFRYADTNAEIGAYTLELLCGWYPRPLRPAVRLGVRSLLDEALRTAFGFAAAPAAVGVVARAALRARATALALMPARSTIRLTRQPRNRSYPGYPEGYRPSNLGPPPPPASIDTRFLRPDTDPGRAGAAPAPPGRRAAGRLTSREARGTDHRDEVACGRPLWGRLTPGPAAARSEPGRRPPGPSQPPGRTGGAGPGR